MFYNPNKKRCRSNRRSKSSKGTSNEEDDPFQD